MSHDRFWAYIHANDGDLTEDLGNYDTVADAVDELVSHMRYQPDGWHLDHTARVVDNALDGGTTIWVAGAGHSIEPVRDDRNPYADEDEGWNAYESGAVSTQYGIAPPEVVIPTIGSEQRRIHDAAPGGCSCRVKTRAACSYSAVRFLKPAESRCIECGFISVDGSRQQRVHDDLCDLPVDDSGLDDDSERVLPTTDAIERMQDADDSLRSYAN